MKATRTGLANAISLSLFSFPNCVYHIISYHTLKHFKSVLILQTDSFKNMQPRKTRTGFDVNIFISPKIFLLQLSNYLSPGMLENRNKFVTRNWS